MLSLKMDIYTQATGIETLFEWANEEEYQQVKKFLLNMVPVAAHRATAAAEDLHFFICRPSSKSMPSMSLCDR